MSSARNWARADAQALCPERRFSGHAFLQLVPDRRRSEFGQTRK